MEAEASGFAGARPSYDRYLALRGKRVTVVDSSIRVTGVVMGIDADGALVLDTDAGPSRVLTGDVSVEGAYK
jgi:biotin-(acetyl-CoA carboxylase) ligase